MEPVFITFSSPSKELEEPNAMLSFFFFFFKLFIYLFLAVLGLRFCARAFSSWRQPGATLHRGARASHYRGLSCCGAQAPDAQAQ